MTIAKVQEVFSYSASGGSATKTVTIATPGAGNTLVLLAQNIAAHSISSVTGGGVTWTKIANWANGAGSVCELWVGPNSSGSGTTISVTVSATYSHWDLSVTEWSGMPATLAADGGSNASTNNPNNVTPSITPTAGQPVLLLASDVTYSTTIVAGPTGGFTAISTAGGSGYGNFAYQIVASASGSYQCGWTDSVSFASSNAGLYAFDGAVVAASSPGAQCDWPNPRRLIFPVTGFLRATELNLIGKDSFFGVAGNPTRDFPVPAGRTAPIALRTWTNPVKLNLAGLDQFFAAPGQSPGQHDWPVPAGRAPVVTLKTHANPTPLNLLGQDTFYASAGQVPTHDWKLPPARRTGSISLLTFTDQFKLELIGQDQFFGLAGSPLTDWPVPRTRKPPALSFTLLVSPGLNVVPDINLGGAGPVIQGFFIPRIAMGYFPEGEP